jgi:hypothetical protein
MTPASQKGMDSSGLPCTIVVRQDVPRFWGLTISGVIRRWQSHFEAVIARQRLGSGFVDLKPMTLSVFLELPLMKFFLVMSQCQLNGLPTHELISIINNTKKMKSGNTN